MTINITAIHINGGANSWQVQRAGGVQHVVDELERYVGRYRTVEDATPVIALYVYETRSGVLYVQVAEPGAVIGRVHLTEHRQGAGGEQAPRTIHVQD
jgi:hypothetical protein